MAGAANTLADEGRPFPKGGASCYCLGLPSCCCWAWAGAGGPGGRVGRLAQTLRQQCLHHIHTPSQVCRGRDGRGGVVRAQATGLKALDLARSMLWLGWFRPRCCQRGQLRWAALLLRCRQVWLHLLHFPLLLSIGLHPILPITQTGLATPGRLLFPGPAAAQGRGAVRVQAGGLAKGRVQVLRIGCCAAPGRGHSPGSQLLLRKPDPVLAKQLWNNVRE